MFWGKNTDICQFRPASFAKPIISILFAFRGLYNTSDIFKDTATNRLYVQDRNNTKK